MTPEKSLRIMNEIIEKSRRDFAKDSGNPLIIWGTLVCITSLAVWYLWHRTGSPAWNWLWFAMAAVGLLFTALYNRKNKPGAKSFLSETIGRIWLSYCFFAMTYSLAAIFIAPLSITAGNVLMLGLCISLTGTLTKLWSLSFLGFITGIGGAVVCRLVKCPEDVMLVMTGMSAIIIFAGLIMNFQYKRLCSRN